MAWRKRLLQAVTYGLGIGYAAVQVNGWPSNKAGWLALVGVVIAATVGKGTASENWLSPNRPVWTPEQREAATK